jgi:hypothetical protein
MLNGVASAIPATLLPFFVADRLQAAGLQPLLLLIYFGAAALGLPLWVRAVRRWGLSPTWRAGMAASVAALPAPRPWARATAPSSPPSAWPAAWPWAPTWPCPAPC